MANRPALVWLTEAPGTSKEASNRKVVRTNAALWGHWGSRTSNKRTRHEIRKFVVIKKKEAVVDVNDDEERLDGLQDSASSVEHNNDEEASGVRTEVNPISGCLARRANAGIPCAAHPAHAFSIPGGIAEKDIISRLYGPFTARFGAITGGAGREWLVSVGLQDNDELLRESLEILALGLCAHDGSALQVRKRYANILARFQSRLDHQRGTAGLASTLSLTLILSLHELIVWDNPQSWIMHLNGMAVIIKLMGPRQICTPAAMKTFRWFRALGMVVDMLLHRPSFMSSPEWLTVPWECSNTPKDMLDLLNDILVQCPGLFAESDRCHAGAAPFDQLDAKVLAFMDSLKAWEAAFIVPPSESLTPTSSPAPLLRVLETLTTCADTSHPLALPVAHYLSGWLMVPRFGTKYVQMLPLPPGDLVRYVLQLCERFAFDNDHQGLMPWTLPTRMAFFTPGQDVAAEFYGFAPRVDKSYAVKIMSYSLPPRGT